MKVFSFFFFLGRVKQEYLGKTHWGRLKNQLAQPPYGVKTGIQPRPHWRTSDDLISASIHFGKKKRFMSERQCKMKLWCSLNLQQTIPTEIKVAFVRNALNSERCFPFLFEVTMSFTASSQQKSLAKSELGHENLEIKSHPSSGVVINHMPPQTLSAVDNDHSSPDCCFYLLQ